MSREQKIDRDSRRLLEKIRDFIINFRKKSSMIGLVLLGVLLGLAWYLASTGLKIKKLSVLSDGVGICFTRVAQTYTAKLLGSESVYLNQRFLGDTQECFADAVMEAEEKFGQDLISVNSKLNTLASDVYWFHERVNSKGSKFVAGRASNVRVGARFEKMEELRDDIIEGIGKHRQQQIDTVSKVKTYLLALVFLVYFLFIFDYGFNLRKRIINKGFDSEAKHVYEQGGLAGRSFEIEEILNNAFKNNDLVYCSKLLSSYHSECLEGKLDIYIAKTSVQDDAKKEEGEVISETTEIIEKQREVFPTHNANLSKVISKVLHILDARFTGERMAFDTDIPDNIEVDVSEDALEQIFYSLFLNSLKSSQTSQRQKVISVKMRKVNSTVVMNFVDSAAGFSPQLLELQSRPDTNDSMELGCDLLVCQELVRDFNGKISFNNVVDQENNVVGRSFEISFPYVGVAETVNVSEVLETKKKRRPQLVFFKKGSKKAILEEIKSLARGSAA